MAFRKSRDDLWERLVAEKDKQLLILSDQVDYLRLQLGIQTRQSALATNPTHQEPITQGMQPWLSEDEEDVKDMLEAGQISQDQVADVLDGLGYSDFTFN